MARESEITLYSVTRSATPLGERAKAAFPLSSVGPRSGPLKIRGARIAAHGIAAVSLDPVLAARDPRARPLGGLRSALRPDLAPRARASLRFGSREHRPDHLPPQ